MVARALQLGASPGISGGPPRPGRWPAGPGSRDARDAELVRRFNAGDEEAFGEIVARYRPRMFAVGFRYLRDAADAEEIAQDTFIRAHRGLARFRGASSLHTWLHRIAFNLSRNRHRQNFSRRRHVTCSFDKSLYDGDRMTLADLVVSEAPGPIRAATSREFSELVANCMGRLGARQREVLVMRNGLSQPYGEIARTLGISIGTVKSRIGRARGSLRVLLEQAYSELQPRTSLFECFEPLRSGGRVAVASL